RPASSTRSSRTRARRTASSTASRRSSPTRPPTPGSACSTSSPPARDPRRRPGDNGHNLSRRRRRPGDRRAREPRPAPALPAAGVGRARSERDLGVCRRCRGGGARRCAIVWQDRRTAGRCAQLDAELIRGRTGLVPDPYFSATKLEWLLAEHGPRDGLAFGTVDSWLVWRLTGGERHVTDATNASRTLLCSLAT